MHTPKNSERTPAKSGFVTSLLLEHDLGTGSGLRRGMGPCPAREAPDRNRERHIGLPPAKRATDAPPGLPTLTSRSLPARSSCRPHQQPPEPPPPRGCHCREATASSPLRLHCLAQFPSWCLRRPSRPEPPSPHEGEGQPRRHRRTRASPGRHPPAAGRRCGEEEGAREGGGHQELGFRLYSELRKRCNRKKVKNTLLQMEYQGTVNILSCIYKLAAKL
jgi:hypothetical protein